MSAVSLSARIRAAVAALGEATLADVRAVVPDATPQWMFALCRAGHLARSGAPRRYVYRIAREAAPYGGTPEERAARKDARRLRANAAARAKYAAERGGKVKPRYVPDPKHVTRPKPTSRQQIVITPPRAPVFAKAPAKASKPCVQRMTSQEWEAQGGKVERLPPGAVSKPLLRFHPPPATDQRTTSD